MSTATIANPSATSVALNTIEARAKHYAEARADLAERTMRYEAELAALQNRHLPALKRIFAEASAEQAQLVKEIKAHPELFQQPRTIQLHGIKVGFQKGKGSIEWADDEKLAAKIFAIMSDEECDVLVKTTHKPLASALKNLDVATLRKLGCTVQETGDFVVVKAVDSEVDKIIKRLLKEGLVEELEAA